MLHSLGLPSYNFMRFEECVYIKQAVASEAHKLIRWHCNTDIKAACKISIINNK